MSELLDWAVQSSGSQPRRVLHIGANTGQEAEYYYKRALDVVWIEADPLVCAALVEHIGKYPGQKAVQCLASDVSGVDVEFHVASNNGGSSSVLRPDRERFDQEWPGIREVSTIKLKTSRLDAAFENWQSEDLKFDIIVADVQGYELPVLRGMGELIAAARVIVAEVNWTTMYENSTVPFSLEDYLLDHGFCRAWLGLSYPQATGVWVRRCPTFGHRLWVWLTGRVYYLASRYGAVKLLKRSGILEVGRRLYYMAKKRPNSSAGTE